MIFISFLGVLRLGYSFLCYMRSSPIQFFVEIGRLGDKAKRKLVLMPLGTNDDTQPTRRKVTSEIKIAGTGESVIFRSEQDKSMSLELQ